ncbi:hypothetical protein Tco_1237374 [Tanacetum coccineum]
MNGVGNELVVKAKRERPRIFVAIGVVVRSNDLWMLTKGCGKRYESKGKEQVSQKVIVEEIVNDKAVWDKVKISNEHLAEIKAKYVGDYKTIKCGQLKEYLDELCIMTKNEIKENKCINIQALKCVFRMRFSFIDGYNVSESENDDVEDNDTEDDDDDYEVGWYDTGVKSD